MNQKFVIIINEKISIGEAINTSAILSSSICSKVTNLIGYDITDKDRLTHSGITKHSIIIVKTSKNKLKSIIKSATNCKLVTAAFTDIAQRYHNDYDGYANELKISDENSINYLGVAIFGDQECVEGLTGKLSLFR